MSENREEAIEHAWGEPIQVPRSADYFLAAEYRRAILWAIGGTFLIASVGLSVGLWNKGQAPIPQVMSAFLLPLLMLFWGMQYLGPRLRVNESGIARRCLWWWDLWPWDDFAEGRICLNDSARAMEYRYKDEGVLPRRLNLGLLETSDAESLNRLIRQVWVPPSPPPLPESIQARSSWPNRFSLDLDKDRLTIHQRDETRSFRWDEIANVEIWRNEHARSDFTELLISLPGREKPVHVRGERLNGVPKADFVGCICRHMSADRLHVFALHGEARSRDEVTARIKRLETRLIDLPRFRRGFVAISAVVFGGLIAVAGLKGVALVVPYSLLLYATNWLLLDQESAMQNKRAQLEDQERALNRGTQSPIERWCPSGSDGTTRSNA
jgi:hypothetical protein